MYYIFAFRSRNQSMRFYETLKRDGVPSRIISTPRAVSVGCGLSVQVSPDYVDSGRKLLGFHNFDSFLGLFFAEHNGCIRRV